MRSITLRNPSKRDNRIVVGTELTTDYQQGVIDGEKKGKVLGVNLMGAAIGAALVIGVQYAQKKRFI